WNWRLGSNRKNGLPITFRTPPAPYREHAYTRGPGFCCVYEQPVYRFGWLVDLWNAGATNYATWDCACVIAWEFCIAPMSQARLRRRLQARRCGKTGGRLWKDAEVNPRVLLFRVWREYRQTALAEAAPFLAIAKPPTLQARCSRHKIRLRDAGPTSYTLTE